MATDWRLGLACFLLAFCSLSYEFVLAQMMSILGGHTVFFYCITIGLYVFSLGIGAIVPVANKESLAVIKQLFKVEIALSILGGGAPFWMIAIDRLAATFGWALLLSVQLAAIPFGILVLAVGFLSGMELPLLLRIAELTGGQQSRVMRLLVLDYVASFVGAFCFPLFLYPALGIVRAVGIFAALNVLSLMLVVPSAVRGWRLLVLGAVFATAIYLVAQGQPISSWLSSVMIAN